MGLSKNVDLKKHTLNLRDGDFDRIALLFPKLGGSVAIRTLVSNYVDKVEANTPSPATSVKDIEL